MRDVMHRQRDQADRALGLDRADRLDDARVRGPEAALAQRLDGDEIAVPRLAGHAGGHEIFARRPALLDRQRPARAVGRGAIDGEGARLELVEDLDHPAGIGGRSLAGVGVELDPHQHPRAEARAPARCRACCGSGGRRMRGAGASPLHSAGLAINSPSRSRSTMSATTSVGRRPWTVERLAAARDCAFGLQVLEDELQFRLGFALDAEGAGDVALGDPRGRALAVGRRRSADEGHHLFARRKHRGSRFSRAADRPSARADGFSDSARLPLFWAAEAPRRRR